VNDRPTASDSSSPSPDAISVSGEPPRSERVPRKAWFGLAVLTLINLLNYLDRLVLPAVAESIKKSELHPTDAQIGLFTSAFIIVYMVAAPFFGAAGDKLSRPKLLAGGIAVWSLATAAGGLAASVGSLLAARAAVGIGEAAYATIAPALLADLFPARLRGRVFAIFFAATPVGGALGYVLGGFADAHWGWRAAFFIAGLPGLVLALLALGLADPPRGAQERESSANEASGFRSYFVLARNVPYRLTILGYAAYTFAVGGIAAWMPVFLQRVHGLSSAVANLQLGGVLVVTGLVGSLAGGWVGDRLLRRARHAYLLMSAVATLVAAPFTWLALTTGDEHIYLASLVVAELLIFSSTGPINSAIVNVVAPTMRAAAMAMCIFTIHIFGDVPSPYLIGVVSDHSSLQRAVLLIPVFVVVSGAIWGYGARARPEARGQRPAAGEPKAATPA
jgi:MFS transporter, Spinster family, sphingosine-1-phosphate transporter